MSQLSLSAFALQEYVRRREKAAILAGQAPAARGQVMAALRCWLTILIRAGGDHGDAAPLLAEAARIAPHFTPAQHRALAADDLAAGKQWRHELARARDNAILAAHDEPSTTRARRMIHLARALGVWIAFGLNPTGASPT